MATYFSSEQADSEQVLLYKIASNFYAYASTLGYAGVAPQQVNSPQVLLRVIADVTSYLYAS